MGDRKMGEKGELESHAAASVIPEPRPPELIDLRDHLSQPEEAHHRSVGRWTLDNWLALTAIVVSAASAFATLMISSNMLDRSIGHEDQVRQRAQAERVLFIDTETQIVQNYSSLPILRVILEVERTNSADGIVFLMGSLGPCQQIDTQKVLTYDPHGNVRVRFIDPSNREWVRKLNGPLKQGRLVPPPRMSLDSGDVAGDEVGLIPPARSGMPEGPPVRQPIPGCVPG